MNISDKIKMQLVQDHEVPQSEIQNMVIYKLNEQVLIDNVPKHLEGVVTSLIEKNIEELINL